MLTLYCCIALLLTAFLLFLLPPILAQGRTTFIEKSGKDTYLFLIAIILLPIAAILFYWHWGASQPLAQFYAQSNPTKTTANLPMDAKQIKAITQKFIDYLNRHPQDAKGWYLLGRLYFDQGNLAQAAKALAHSLKIDETHTEVMAQYVYILYFLHQQKFTPESLVWVNKVLRQDANNPTLLNLFAADAFSHHHYQLAITYWQRLQSQYPQNSPEFLAITRAIEACHKKLL